LLFGRKTVSVKLHGTRPWHNCDRRNASIVAANTTLHRTSLWYREEFSHSCYRSGFCILLTMNTEISSSEIILESLKEHGKGELFFRADGLEFEERRADTRRQYLESHPEIDAKYLDAMQKAAITPGMTRNEVIVAWGLLDEDTRTVFGHVTDDGRTAYAYFTGFAVGEPFALYIKDEVVTGVRQTDELVPPHELELTMRLAEENHRLFYFYEGKDGQLRGSNVEQYHMDWDTQHHHLYTIETVVPCGLREVEAQLRVKGLIRQYEIALLRLGYDSRTAPDELRTRVALSTLPYPHIRKQQTTLKTIEAPQVPNAPIPLPPSSRESLVDPVLGPPEKWRAYLAFGHQQEVAFPFGGDQVELITVKWQMERLFRVEQVPLLVNDISLYDLVEAEWHDGDLVPHFKRVVEKSGYRTIRAVVTDSEGEASVRHFAKLNTADRKRYRYEKEVLAFTTSESELDKIAKEWLSYLPVSWVYTDTLSQD
jgi:hypothetical protein